MRYAENECVMLDKTIENMTSLLSFYPCDGRDSVLPLLDKKKSFDEKSTENQVLRFKPNAFLFCSYT